MKTDVFGARATFETGAGSATLYRLGALEKAGLVPDLGRLPVLDPDPAGGGAAQRRRGAGHARTT